MVLSQSPQEEEALVNLLDQTGAVGCPAEILRDVDPQEFEASDTMMTNGPRPETVTKPQIDLTK